jgi:hypothetical protein
MSLNIEPAIRNEEMGNRFSSYVEYMLYAKMPMTIAAIIMNKSAS